VKNNAGVISKRAQKPYYGSVTAHFV